MKVEAMESFRNNGMTWVRVLVIAVLSAIVTAALNCIPALEGTSAKAPATTMEVWVVLALYIVVNCSSWKDAALKTFVFFLVSQPLIYLLEVPFLAAGWGLFKYYPYWAAWTVATLPIAAMTYHIKKDDVLSALILSLANAVILVSGTPWLNQMMDSFPHYLIAVLFCLIIPFVLIFVLLKQKKSRLVALAATVAVIIALAVSQTFFSVPGSLGFAIDESHWQLAGPAPAGLEVEVHDGYVNLSSNANGSYIIDLVSDDGRTATYNVTVEGSSHKITAEKAEA